MLIGLRIISILFDLFLASVLFFRSISKSKQSKKTLLLLCCCFLLHVAFVFIFLESRVFLVSNLLLSIVESSLVGLYFGYSFRAVSIYRADFIDYFCLYCISYSRASIWTRLSFCHFTLVSYCIVVFLALFYPTSFSTTARLLSK